MPRSSTKGGFPAPVMAKPVAAAAKPPAKKSPAPAARPVAAASPATPARAAAPMHDLEIKDAPLIFQTVWSEMEEEFGREHMRFPKEIFWLNGAPGAGKGTHTRFILKHRGYAHQPVIVSELLQSPALRKRHGGGRLPAHGHAGRVPEAFLSKTGVAAQRVPRHRAGAGLPQAAFPHSRALY
jgi:hypothetical protein